MPQCRWYIRGFLNQLPVSEVLAKCTSYFFVRPLGRPERIQNIAEVNNIGIAVHSIINLYAQLTFLAKLRTKDSRPSFIAGTAMFWKRSVHPKGRTKKLLVLSWTFGFIYAPNLIQKFSVMSVAKSKQLLP